MTSESNTVSILVVDDKPENLLALEAILTDPTIKLVKAQSGAKALKHVLEQEFALILMDASMPGMDGFETLQMIRSREKTRHLPVIFVTATRKENANLSEGYNLGAVDYIFKPIDPAILRAKVSVFVELYRKNYKIQMQAAELEQFKTQLEDRLGELEHLNAELKELSQQNARSRDQAQAASKFKSEFLATMSHEIRTPMNGIIGMTNLLLRTELNPQQKQFVGTVRDAGQSLLSVVNDILDFSKVEAGIKFEKSEFYVSTAIEGICDLLSPQARANNVSIALFVSPEIPEFLIGDAGRLRQILVNITGNAIKFSENGSVMVSATVPCKTDSEVVLRFEVSDNGIGISQGDIERIFHPFEQADSSLARSYTGTGLGLSICKGLVEAMGGFIGVDRKDTRGSLFWFELPFKTVKNGKSRQANSTNLNGLKVLIASDDEISRNIIEAYTRSWGMVATSVEHPQDVLHLVSKESRGEGTFDLVIIDLSSPGDLETELSESIKAIKLANSLQPPKQILVTKFDSLGPHENHHLEGFDAYVTKPIKQSELFDRIVLALNDELDLEKFESQLENEKRGFIREFSDKLILVVEDNAVNQQVALLELQYLGMCADAVGNGNEAIEAISNIKYDLVLMDCQMPEMDGFEATKKIRELQATMKSTPIIAMTAQAMEGDRERCLEAGMNDYISKPIDRDTLVTVLHRWLTEPQNSTALSQNEVDVQELSRTNSSVNESAAATPMETGDTTRASSSQLAGSRCILEIKSTKSTEPAAKIPLATPIMQASHGLNDNELFDHEFLREKFGDRWLMLIHLFIESMNKQLINLESSIAATDKRKSLFDAHQLKSVAATLRLGKLKTICAALEDTARNEDWQTSSDLFNKVKELCERLALDAKTLT